MDIIDKASRSALMAKVKSKNTKPEMQVRLYLHARGLRYRLHDKSLPGCPDIVFKSKKIALFVNGCFWHGHEGCKRSGLPKTRREFWEEKIGENKRRDARIDSQLRELGWESIVIWQCELNDASLSELYQRIITK